VPIIGLAFKECKQMAFTDDQVYQLRSDYIVSEIQKNIRHALRKASTAVSIDDPEEKNRAVEKAFVQIESEMYRTFHPARTFMNIASWLSSPRLMKCHGRDDLYFDFSAPFGVEKNWPARGFQASWATAYFWLVVYKFPSLAKINGKKIKFSSYQSDPSMAKVKLTLADSITTDSLTAFSVTLDDFPQESAEFAGTTDPHKINISYTPADRTFTIEITAPAERFVTLPSS
jgi:hypothetical protein